MTYSEPNRYENRPGDDGAEVDRLDPVAIL